MFRFFFFLFFVRTNFKFAPNHFVQSVSVRPRAVRELFPHFYWFFLARHAFYGVCIIFYGLRKAANAVPKYAESLEFLAGRDSQLNAVFIRATPTFNASARNLSNIYRSKFRRLSVRNLGISRSIRCKTGLPKQHFQSHARDTCAGCLNINIQF